MDNKNIKKISIAMDILDIIRYALICFVVLTIIFTFIIRVEIINGDSMDPTLDDSQIALSLTYYDFMSVDRFDIVVVEHGDDLWVKRVIALPNETIEYKDNKLYINDEYVEEDFLNQEYIDSLDLDTDFSQDVEKTKLGEDEIYLVGDNRDVSYDSRYVGAFKKSSIVSKSLFIFYPFSDIGIK